MERPIVHTLCAAVALWVRWPVCLFLSAVLLLTGCGQHQQQIPESRPIPRIAYLSTANPGLPIDPETGLPVGQLLLDTFREEFANLGWVEGKNVHVAYRFILPQETDNIREIVDEVVATNPDLIVSIGISRTRVVKEATSSIPVVMVGVTDPVENGVVERIGTPSGNITGIGDFSTGIAAKRLQLLKLALPSLQKVAVLSPPNWMPPNTARNRQWLDVANAGASLGIEIQLVEAGDEGSAATTLAALDRAMASARQFGADAVYLLPDGTYDSHRFEIARMAIEYGLPTVYYYGGFADAGGFMTYATNTVSIHRRAAHYVDRFLRGTPLVELPIEMPSDFELVVNFSTAEALGIVLDRSFLLNVDRVVR